MENFFVYFKGKPKKTVQKEEPKDREDRVNIELPWGQQTSLPGRPGETLLSFTFQSFKGGTITFTTPNFGYNGFLNVSSSADGGVQVRADLDHFA